MGSIFNGRVHPSGSPISERTDDINRRRADSEQAKREQDCAERIKSAHDAVVANHIVHQDRLRNGGK
jgi:hypothetical protein